MSESKRIVVAGATGTIGKALCKSLIEREYAVVVFSRNPEKAREIVPGAVDYPINLTAPEPVTNRDFARTLGKVLHRPAWFPVPGFMLKVFLGEVAAVIIRGRRVVPKKILEAGYQFQYSTLETAIRQLLHRAL